MMNFQKILTATLALVSVVACSDAEPIDPKVDRAIEIGSLLIESVEPIAQVRSRSTQRGDNECRYVDSFMANDIICVEVLSAEEVASYFYYQMDDSQQWSQIGSEPALMLSHIEEALRVRAHFIPGVYDLSNYTWHSADDRWCGERDGIYPDILQDYDVELLDNRLLIDLTRLYNGRIDIFLSSDDRDINLEEATVTIPSSIAVVGYEAGDNGYDVSLSAVDFREMTRKANGEYEMILSDFSANDIQFRVTLSGVDYVSSIYRIDIEPNRYSVAAITLKISKN